MSDLTSSPELFDSLGAVGLMLPLSHASNHATHWYRCAVCGGKSLDSDTQALSGALTLEPRHVSHDTYCPGASFPNKYVRRVERLY